MKIIYKQSLFLSLVLIFAYVICNNTVPCHARNSGFSVKKVVNDVFVSSAGKGKKLRLSEGDTFASGDMLYTGSMSSMIFKTPSGNLISLMENTVITIEGFETGNLRNDRITIKNGKIYSQVNKISPNSAEFSIKTPLAVCGVRGTFFQTEVRSGRDTFKCLNGKIHVSDGSKSYEVKEMQKISSTESGITKPVQLTKEDLQEIHSDLKSLSDGFGEYKDMDDLQNKVRQYAQAYHNFDLDMSAYRAPASSSDLASTQTTVTPTKNNNKQNAKNDNKASEQSKADDSKSPLNTVSQLPPPITEGLVNDAAIGFIANDSNRASLINQNITVETSETGNNGG